MAEWNPFEKPEWIALTGRYREIDRLQKILDCKQYEGKADWWEGKDQNGKDVPLRERAPCIRYPLAKAAVQQVVHFLFGEGRYPVAKAKADEASDSVIGVALDEEQANAVSDWLAACTDLANLKQQVGAVAEKGIGCKTSVVVLGFKDGLPRIEMPHARDCWPEFRDGDPALEVTRMVWCYRFNKLVADEDGKPETKPHLFRRDYDATNTLVYPDVEIKTGGKIEWPKPVAVPHGFTFCPVRWIRNESEQARGIDGRGLFEGQDGTLEALDFALSQRHTGIYHAGYPQPWETGVEDGDGPGQDGRTAGDPKNYSAPDAVDPNDPRRVLTAPTDPARKSGPQYVHSYTGEKVKVGLRETTGKAFEASTAHVKDARSRFLESISVVLTSMVDTMDASRGIGAQMSGRFLALAHAPLLALVGKYRDTWWPCGLRPILDMLLRMLVELETGESKQRVLVPGSAKVARILKPFASVDVGNGPQWIGPTLEPHWGRYFNPSTAEVKEAVEAAAAAVELGVISLETAATHLAQEFGVQSPADELQQAQDEADERRKQAQEDMRSEAAAFHKAGADDGDTDESASRAGTRPNKKRPRGRRGGATAAANKAGKEGASAQQSVPGG